jgi:hypothetical protein
MNFLLGLVPGDWIPAFAGMTIAWLTPAGLRGIDDRLVNPGRPSRV